MATEIWVEDRAPIRLESGEFLELGRFDGPGQLAANDVAVSRRHAIIGATEHGWTVQCTGSRSGLVVYDHETPSSIHVPRGVGPVVLPFAEASVIIEVQQRRYASTVHSPGLAGWAGSWASVLGEGPDSLHPGSTRLPWDGLRWCDSRTGRPLRWYQVLVAMCEPFLLTPATAAVPSAAELARRLNTTANMVESKLVGDVRRQLGLAPHTPNLGRTMVTLAINQGLVTATDLSVLDVMA